MVVSDWAGWTTPESSEVLRIVVPHVDIKGLLESVEIARNSSVTGKNTVKPILNWLAGRSGQNVPLILSRHKDQAVVEARQFAAWILSASTNLSSIQIGVALRRDHTTILHSRKVVSRRIQEGVYPDEWLTDCAKWIEPYSPYYPIIKPWVVI